MIEHPWGLTVYGAASVKAMPDLVRTRFRVVRLEQTPSAAFAAVRAVRRRYASMMSPMVPWNGRGWT